MNEYSAQENISAKISRIPNKKYLLLILVLLLAAVISFLFLLSSSYKLPSSVPSAERKPPNINTLPTGQTTNRTNDKLIAKVGEENIYESDLQKELSYFPPATINTRAFLLEKIASDSVVLQSGAKEKLLTLDSSIFNSLNKDYKKRMEAVQTVKKTIEDQAQQIEGSVVSIWFNNDGPGSLGYEKGKELVEQKITRLHQKVKSGQITIQAAAEEIKNDAELAQVDTNYKGNAILNFSANPGFMITFDQDFNQTLWSLAPNEVSEIFLIKDKERGTQSLVDSVYMFGMVQKKIVNENIDSFQNWFIKQKSLYDIKYL